MAAPAQVTTKNLTSAFVTDKQLSDNTDELLRLQGMSWLKRRAVSACTVALSVRHYTDDAGVEHIDIDQKLIGAIPGGISGGNDNHILDFQERQYDDEVFGLLIAKTRRISVEEIEDEFLRTGWSEDTVADGVIHTIAWSDPVKNTSGYKWTAEQTWGFEVINGERKHVKRVTLTSSGKKNGPVRVRLVYGYTSKN
ncbi:hypothetical protein ID866_1173 [Astraeus odoratus]|nr:hypothetical protein ID866_1173 [Astraeus odoratus]